MIFYCYDFRCYKRSRTYEGNNKRVSKTKLLVEISAEAVRQLSNPQLSQCKSQPSRVTLRSRSTGVATVVRHHDASLSSPPSIMAELLAAPPSFSLHHSPGRPVPNPTTAPAAL